LKGGYALELRFNNTRATIDIDLTVRQIPIPFGNDASEIVRDMLQSAAAYSLGDWFEFNIGPAMMDLDAAPYGGARFPIEASMDGQAFSRFHLDAGIGDVMIQPLATVTCRDWLGFAGIGSPLIPTISGEQQFAEKIHAYTLPRSSTNSRVKDLVDLALLAGSATLAPDRVIDALRLTFERRKTHSLPSVLFEPPAEWERPFRALSEECNLSGDMNAAFALVRAFFDRVMGR